MKVELEWLKKVPDIAVKEKTGIDRYRAYRDTDKQAMRTIRAVPVGVLLSVSRGDRIEPASYELDRRAIYRMPHEVYFVCNNNNHDNKDVCRLLHQIQPIFLS